MYEYRAVVEKVIDGDTIQVVIDLGFSIRTVQRVRLLGVDTPEMNSSDPEKRAAGLRAKLFSSEWCAERKSNVVIRSHKPGGGDKYGRYLAEIFGSEPMGRSLNATLISEGLAVAYDGGAKEA